MQWPNPNATFTLDYYFTGKVGKIVWENVALFGHQDILTSITYLFCSYWLDQSGGNTTNPPQSWGFRDSGLRKLISTDVPPYLWLLWLPVRFNSWRYHISGGNCRNFGIPVHRDVKMIENITYMCVLYIQTPPGVYCPNRKVTMKIPDILNSQVYHYRMEIVSEYDATVQTSIVSLRIVVTCKS